MMDSIFQSIKIRSFWKRKWPVESFHSPISEEPSIMFRLSLSHLIAAPAMATEPYNKNP